MRPLVISVKVLLYLLRTQTNLFPSSFFWFFFTSKNRPFGAIIYMPKSEFVIPVPPQLAFAHQPDDELEESEKDPLLTTKANYEPLPTIEKLVGAGIEYRLVDDNGVTRYKVIGPADYAPSKQGWFIYHVGRKYPQRGFPFPHALKACEKPKRYLMNWISIIANKDMILPIIALVILPKRIRGRILDRFLMQYVDYADGYLKPYYFANEFFSQLAFEVKVFVHLFLEGLGVSNQTANRFAFSFATLIENDSAYWSRIMDLMSETTKDRVLKNQVREAKRLIEILAKRDARKHLVAKFNKFALLLKYGFFFIRNQFKDALEAIDFEKMQYEELDRQFVKHWIRYDFFGKTIEERLEMYPLDTHKKEYLKYGELQ